ncbi:hypothetical protein K438DRAFT_1292840 [Mycena galopus ATCC 62051]|nr:hypothetical protein K438DRAFT_1292840 [Mycena galopus ATCC 62051]
MTEFWYRISRLWVGTFFYGIYSTLFCICIYILLRRPQHRGKIVLLVTAIALFTLSTVQLVLLLVISASDISGIVVPYQEIVYTVNILYGVNNIIADGLVIYRCYCIWNHNIYAVIFPMMLLVGTSIFGLDLALDPYPFYALSLATNILVTALTAGRIWWFYRTARAYSMTDSQKRYASTISILVESGALYSVAVTIFLVVVSAPSARGASPAALSMLQQVMGIAPTLIIVRVGMGATVESVQSTLKPSGAMSDPHRLPFTISYPRSLDTDWTSIPVDVEKGGLSTA